MSNTEKFLKRQTRAASLWSRVIEAEEYVDFLIAAKNICTTQPWRKTKMIKRAKMLAIKAQARFDQYEA